MRCGAMRYWPTETVQCTLLCDLCFFRGLNTELNMFVSTMPFRLPRSCTFHLLSMLVAPCTCTFSNSKTKCELISLRAESQGSTMCPHAALRTHNSFFPSKNKSAASAHHAMRCAGAICGKFIFFVVFLDLCTRKCCSACIV